MPQLPANLSQLTPEQKKELEEKLRNMSPEQLAELQKQQCIFCQIISGKIPSKKIYQDEICVAIIDINPATKGHLLIIPKDHYAIMPQMPEKVITHLFVVCKYLSKVLLKTLKVGGTNVFIANGPAAGQRAQHFMIHLIPRKESDGVLDIEEKLFDSEMLLKIKNAVEGKLKEVLGFKEEAQMKLTMDNGGGRDIDKDVNKKGVASDEKDKTDNLQENKSRKSGQPEHFITSLTAKRYHKEKCAFAQNITDNKKLILTKEQAEETGRKPCTCVTGKKLPLRKGGSENKHKKSSENKLNKAIPKKKISEKKEKKENKTSKKSENKDESNSLGSSEGTEGKKSDEGVTLDDIADLFK